MKKDLQPELVQRWTLVGMSRLHRAIVRRSVNSTVVSQHVSFRVQWKCSDILEEGQLAATDVLIVDRNEPKALADILEHRRQSNGDLPTAIVLLWSWAAQGKKDLLWCTELLFSGVVHNAESLDHWVRACVNRGKTQTEQGCSLISGIHLPTVH
jgi:hypothetical protein